jgi:cyanoexosortase A
MESLSLSHRDPRFWLLGIGAGLLAIHLTLTWRLDDEQLISNSLLLWTGTGYLLWHKRSHLHPHFHASNLLGLIPIGFILLRSSFFPNGGFLAVLPLLAALGLALLNSGIRGLTAFWRELLILACLALPVVLFLFLTFDISLYTAKAASFVLWYAGKPLVLEGAVLYLGQGAVNVAGGCSGQEQMFHLLGIAVMACLIFPFRRCGLLVGVAIAIAFGVNVLRVCLMTLLVAAGNQASFVYWHDGSGSLLFSLVSVGLFGWIYSELSSRDELNAGTD